MARIARMTREQFISTFADTRTYPQETNGRVSGTVHHGSSLGLNEMEIQNIRPEEYEVAWGWCDLPYRMVFIDLDGLSTIVYCEGDISVTIHADQHSFNDELLEARRCYPKPRYMDRDYDPSLPTNHRDPEGQISGTNSPREEG